MHSPAIVSTMLTSAAMSLIIGLRSGYRIWAITRVVFIFWYLAIVLLMIDRVTVVAITWICAVAWLLGIANIITAMAGPKDEPTRND